MNAGLMGKNNSKIRAFLERHLFALVTITLLLITIGFYILSDFISVDNSGENLTINFATDRSESAFIDDDTFMGSEDSDVLIVEFGDFMCKFCGELHRDVEPLWRKDYIETGKAKYVFRDFISADHEQAFPAAQASECADEQGKQWEMYDLLYDNAFSKDAWALIDEKQKLLAVFRKYALQLILYPKNFDNCMSNEEISNEIKQDIFAGLATGVSGTPTIFIGNDETGFVKIRGAQPYSVYKQIIDEKLGENQ